MMRSAGRRPLIGQQPCYVAPGDGLLLALLVLNLSGKGLIKWTEWKNERENQLSTYDTGARNTVNDYPEGHRN